MAKNLLFVCSLQKKKVSKDVKFHKNIFPLVAEPTNGFGVSNTPLPLISIT